MTIGTRLALAALGVPLGAALLLPAAAWAAEKVDIDIPYAASCGRDGSKNMATVEIRNRGEKGLGYNVLLDGKPLRSGYGNGYIPADTSKNVEVYIKPGTEAKIDVSVGDDVYNSKGIVKGCRAERKHTGGWDDRLPDTGPPTDLVGKLATAGGLVLTGGIVWWYGSLWPRQTPEGPFNTTRTTTRRRYPDLKL